MNEGTQNNEITVGISKLQGNGLFALKEFKKGDIVSDWNPNNKYLSNEEVETLPNDQKRYIAIHNGKYLLIAAPERHMNHSCDPNTRNEGGTDYALRDIKVGEEITGNYDNEGSLMGFDCLCQSTDCKKVVVSRRPNELNHE